MECGYSVFEHGGSNRYPWKKQFHKTVLPVVSTFIVQLFTTTVAMIPMKSGKQKTP
jgi:hypothetical protein